jgi:hypothetical protein
MISQVLTAFNYSSFVGDSAGLTKNIEITISGMENMRPFLN